MQDEDSGRFQSYFQKSHSKTFTFQMMAKQDQYNVSAPRILDDSPALTVWQDQIRVRYQCRRASPIDFPSNSAWLAQQIESLSQSLSVM